MSKKTTARVAYCVWRAPRDCSSLALPLRPMNPFAATWRRDHALNVTLKVAKKPDQLAMWFPLARVQPDVHGTSGCRTPGVLQPSGTIKQKNSHRVGGSFFVW